MNFIWNFRVLLNDDYTQMNLSEVMPLDGIRSVLKSFPIKHIVFSNLEKELMVNWLEKHNLRHHFGSSVYQVENVVELFSCLRPLLNGNINYLITNQQKDIVDNRQISTIVFNPFLEKDYLFQEKKVCDFLIFREISNLRLVLEIGFSK